MNSTSIKADLKMILREPILILFLLIPVFILIVFKLAVLFLLPFVYRMTGMDFLEYHGYILTVVFLMTPSMLGTVAGFLMIDERDNRIYELMSITPIGYSGYIANRLLLPFLVVIAYTILGYFVLNIHVLNFFILIYIALLAGIEAILIGLLLFKLAEDKVKGLTYSKALSGFSFFAFADLIHVQWVHVIAAMCPFYWISRLVNHPEEVLSILMAAVVHAVGLVIALRLKI